MNPEHHALISSLSCWSDTAQISPLSGGMTNFNYKVVSGNRNYVVRLGTDVPEHLVWRENEGVCSEVAARCGFSPNVLHRQEGVLVIDFIEGKTLQESDIRNQDMLDRLLVQLKRFHYAMQSSFSSYPMLFWVFQVLRHYQNMLVSGNSQYSQKLERLALIAGRLENEVGEVRLVFGHNDLLPANFIDDGDKIWIIDFDYAGFNSPLFDLANLASNSQLDEELERYILAQYFETEVDEQLWQRYGAMKCASLLRETMWSMVSEIYSKIDFDYSNYTRENTERFERCYAAHCQDFGDKGIV